MGKKTFPVNVIFGKVFMSFGDRLRQERERLGMSQPKFAVIAATTKQTLFSWESGRTAPDGFQLAAIAAAGADVRYIVTGQRDGPAPLALSPDEQVLLDGYRALDAATRKRLLAFVLGGEPQPSGPSSQFVISSGSGQAAGRKIINKREKS